MIFKYIKNKMLYRKARKLFEQRDSLVKVYLKELTDISETAIVDKVIEITKELYSLFGISINEMDIDKDRQELIGYCITRFNTIEQPKLSRDINRNYVTFMEYDDYFGYRDNAPIEDRLSDKEFNLGRFEEEFKTPLSKKTMSPIGGYKRYKGKSTLLNPLCYTNGMYFDEDDLKIRIWTAFSLTRITAVYWNRLFLLMIAQESYEETIKTITGRY